MFVDDTRLVQVRLNAMLIAETFVASRVLETVSLIWLWGEDWLYTQQRTLNCSRPQSISNDQNRSARQPRMPRLISTA
jgi:hypothetical protein